MSVQLSNEQLHTFLKGSEIRFHKIDIFIFIVLSKIFSEKSTLKLHKL